MLRKVFSVLAVLCCFVGNALTPLLADEATPANATAAQHSPVVVELFTSQGCSSCPPADKLLTGLVSMSEKQGFPIYCLSFHVDYWNSLGWEDPYSSKQFTDRQRRYAKALQTRTVYTPQMIVNGQTEFVGSRGQDAKQAIKTALATPVATQVELQATLSSKQKQVEVQYTVTDAPSDARLNVAIVQKHAENKVPRGENSGRELSHVHVVRTLKATPIKAPIGKLTLSLPTDLTADKTKVVAYVQDPQTMKISGATVAEVGEE